MNKNTFNLIRDASTFLQLENIYQYQEFVKSPINTAMIIISVVEASATELTLSSISNLSGIHIDTVAETIRALRLGGYPFTVRQAGTQGHKLLISKVQT